MSLFNLIHKSVVIKFADCAKPQFDPTVSYVFRLTAVDGMGFLELQDVKLGAEGAHESASEPYWINKDLILELREFSPKVTNLRFSGPTPKAVTAKPAVAAAPKLPKAKAPPKPKPVVV